jgi:hypothetical protein
MMRLDPIVIGWVLVLIGWAALAAAMLSRYLGWL